MKKDKKYKAKPGVAMASESMVTYDAPAVFNRYAIEDEYSLVRKAREGVPTEAFYSLADVIKMPEKNLAAVLNLSARTISNYRDQHKSLDPANSEHLLKLINLFSRGEEIFGSIEEFKLWLERPFWNSTERPVDLITTPGGVDLVLEEIDKLAQGYPL